MLSSASACDAVPCADGLPPDYPLGECSVRCMRKRVMFFLIDDFSCARLSMIKQVPERTCRLEIKSSALDPRTLLRCKTITYAALGAIALITKIRVQSPAFHPNRRYESLLIAFPATGMMLAPNNVSSMAGKIVWFRFRTESVIFRDKVSESSTRARERLVPGQRRVFLNANEVA